MLPGKMRREAPGVLPAYRPDDILQLLQMLRILRLQQGKKHIRVEPSSPLEVDPLILQSRTRPCEHGQQLCRQLRYSLPVQSLPLRTDFCDLLR
ncbi:hypothetical protein D3C75_1239380 [compost metagenome]